MKSISISFATIVLICGMFPKYHKSLRDMIHCPCILLVFSGHGTCQLSETTTEIPMANVRISQTLLFYPE